MTPMVDPVGGADYNSSETSAVPNSANTDSVNLAWSRGNDLPDVPDFPGSPGLPPAGGGRQEAGAAGEPAENAQAWATAWTRAAALLLVCLGLAMVIVVAGWAMHQDTPSGATQPARTTAAPVTTSAPATTTVASTPDQDSRYLAALSDKGIEFANPKNAVFNGKTVCQNLDAKMTVQQIVAQFTSSSPDFSVHADDFVAVSVRAYCPQYSKLVAAY